MINYTLLKNWTNLYIDMCMIATNDASEIEIKRVTLKEFKHSNKHSESGGNSSSLNITDLIFVNYNSRS